MFDEFEKTYRMPLESELKSKSDSDSGTIIAESHEDRWVRRRRRYDDDDRELPKPSQDAILTLLDGVNPSNMLFILTANDKPRITENLMDRPGRMLHSLEFSATVSKVVGGCDGFRGSRA